MSSAWYELLALAARYWFILLGVLIVLRAFRWLRRDRADKHRRLRRLPDAGTIGEFVVLAGSEELPENTLIPVPWEGTLGFLRTCDVVVPVDNVAGRHCDFSFRSRVGLTVNPRRHLQVMIDGETIRSAEDAARHPMQHGSELRVGDAVLWLRIFAGIEIGHAAARRADPLPAAGSDPQPAPSAEGTAPAEEQQPALPPVDAPYHIGVPGSAPDSGWEAPKPPRRRRRRDPE